MCRVDHWDKLSYWSHDLPISSSFCVAAADATLSAAVPIRDSLPTSPRKNTNRTAATHLLILVPSSGRAGELTRSVSGGEVRRVLSSSVSGGSGGFVRRVSRSSAKRGQPS